MYSLLSGFLSVNLSIPRQHYLFCSLVNFVKCEAGQFSPTTFPVNEGAIGQCKIYTATCGIGTKFSASSTKTADRTCPDCVAGSTFQDATSHSDTSCKTCTSCGSGYTTTVECTTTNDRQCTASQCTCPNGTPTVAGSSGGSLCETDSTEDCSACNAGYTISSTAALGLQTCNANTCTPTQVANSDKATSNTITGTSN